MKAAAIALTALIAAQTADACPFARFRRFRQVIVQQQVVPVQQIVTTQAVAVAAPAITAFYAYPVQAPAGPAYDDTRLRRMEDAIERLTRLAEQAQAIPNAYRPLTTPARPGTPRGSAAPPLHATRPAKPSTANANAQNRSQWPVSPRGDDT